MSRSLPYAPGAGASTVGGERTVGVLYDAGSACAAEVAAAARCCDAELFLVVDRASEHVRARLPVLTRRFALCDITGLAARDAARAVSEFVPDGLHVPVRTGLDRRDGAPPGRLSGEPTGKVGIRHPNGRTVA